ncbi:pyridoxal-phosphate dependent enzyme [Stappia sp. BW2]|jgi:threonine dehydratase|uniref:threonine ammonia-lyase n=1 Tax=Stappia sp. BW2 TaxID=2592622 RepID=UPI0011DEB4E8|nr:pyridoxal-phosphate dependent enzyme [Stappia sp. BW2]TYC79063.1 pyridoxal-phosphate dependent enzyme [Stappia sp. BW2]
MDDPADITLDRIRSRHRELAVSIIRTPSVELGSSSVKRVLDQAKIYLKLEAFQLTGTFKARGALSVAHSIPKEERQNGLTGASAGNHAIAVAWAARQMGVPAKVVMQSTANPFRVERARSEGAEVVLADGGQATFAEAERLMHEEGFTFVHPFEGAGTTLGTAGVGLELMEDVSDLNAIVVAVGGGGLISGVAAAVKQMNPRCMVFGVEPISANAVSRGLAANRPVTIEKPDTIADSLAPPMSLPFSLSLTARYVDDVVTVSDDDLCAALVIMQEQALLAVEPAAAAAMAGALGPLRQRLKGKRVAMIVCGSNIDAASYAKLHKRGHLLMPTLLR